MTVNQPKFATIKLPSGVKQFEKGWCRYSVNFNKILIDFNNRNLKLYNNEFLIGKTDTKSDKFDILIYCKRDIKKATIPSFIKIIGSYSFSECKFLEKVDFQSNSELEIIEEFAFSNSAISIINIPPTLTYINNGLTCDTANLFDVFLDNNNKFYKSYKNEFIIGKSNSMKDVFDVLVFIPRNAKEVIIPSFIKTIGPYAFNNCMSLQKVVFQQNSELEFIDEFIFAKSSIKSIIIPSSTTCIGESSFFGCSELKKIVFE